MIHPHRRAGTRRSPRFPPLPLLPLLLALALAGAPRAGAQTNQVAEVGDTQDVAPADSTRRGWQLQPEFGRPEMFRPGAFCRAGSECRPAFDLWIRGGWCWYATGTVDTAGVRLVVSAFDPRTKRWGPPAAEPAFAGFEAADPWISADGSHLYFAGRPRGGRGGFDIYATHRNGHGWATPVRLPDAVNGPGNEASPWETANGTLYFTSDRPGGLGGWDVWRCRRVAGAYQPAENLGPAVNSSQREMDLCVDAGERWLVVSTDRPAGEGGLDLWTCQADSAGAFAPAVNVEAPVNSPADDYAPVVWAPPGDAGYPGWTRYFFYSSNRVRNLAPLRNSGRWHGRGEPGEEPGGGRADVYQTSLVSLGLPRDSVW